MKFLKSPLFIVACLSVMPATASAQMNGLDKPFVGMHNLKVAPKEAAPALKETDEETAAPEEDAANTLPVYKTLAPKDALVKQDDLETWNHIDEAALANNELEIQKLIHVIESDRGAVPPQGLFLAAKSLADKGHMEEAAIYLFVAQLRLEFDMARWPSTPNKADVKRRDQDKKKSPDQMSPNQNGEVRMDNPHSGVKYLGDQIGAPIIAWVIKNPDRMDKTIKMAKAWDSSSPYAYLPDYDLTEPVPFEKWERLLVRTREGYFSRMMNWQKLMGRARG